MLLKSLVKDAWANAWVNGYKPHKDDVSEALELAEKDADIEAFLGSEGDEGFTDRFDQLKSTIAECRKELEPAR